MSLQRNRTDLIIPRELLAPLVLQFGHPANLLSRSVGFVHADAGSADALSWLNSRDVGEQNAWREAGTALATPLLIADVKLLVELETIFDVQTVVTSWDDGAALYMLVDNETGGTSSIQLLRNRPTFCDTLRLYLTGEHPLARSRISLQLTQSEFLVLIGILELSRRKSYEALLSHRSIVKESSVGELEAHLSWQQATDDRWVVPFVTWLAPELRDPLAVAALEEALDLLVDKGLLAWTDDGKIRMDEGGSFVYHALREPDCMLRLAIEAATPGGSLIQRRAVMFRGASSLWYADLGENKREPVQLSTIELDVAGTILDKLLTPTGEPGSAEPPERLQSAEEPPRAHQGATHGGHTCTRCGESIPSGVRFCASCGAPAANGSDAMPSLSCPSCGAVASPDTRFCGNCGQRLR